MRRTARRSAALTAPLGGHPNRLSPGFNVLGLGFFGLGFSGLGYVVGY